MLKSLTDYKKIIHLGVLRKLLIILFLTGFAFAAAAQERMLQGIVFDDLNKQRLSRVYIYNTRSDKGVYNNLKGEFTLNVQRGDTLVVALEGYAVDTATIHSQSVVLFYLKRNTILLQQVTIVDTLLSPEKQLEATQKAYKNIYRVGDSKDLLNVGSGGVGLGIDALYSLLSREGKNARFLQKIIERDYRQAIISYRYTGSLVTEVTQLRGESLKDFMLQYRPSYQFILEANDYSLINFIKASYGRYLQDPAAYRLPPLR